MIRATISCFSKVDRKQGVTLEGQFANLNRLLVNSVLLFKARHSATSNNVASTREYLRFYVQLRLLGTAELTTISSFRSLAILEFDGWTTKRLQWVD